MKQVIIYTDGACSGNPGTGGWGALIFLDSQKKELCGRELNTTNNRMEMMSAIKAFEELDKIFARSTHACEMHKKFCTVELYSDSQYLIKGITQWINSWLKTNWLNSCNKPVKNQELWKKLLELSKPYEISWNWVKGHNCNEFNEYVDRLAKSQYKTT